MIRFAALLLWVGSTATADRLPLVSSASETVVRHLSASAPQHTRHHRSLFGGYTNVICSLSKETLPAIWNDEDQMYYLPDIESRLGETNNTEPTKSEIQDVIDGILVEYADNDIQMVRLCWCTQYAQLPHEFCGTLLLFLFLLFDVDRQ